MSATVDQATPSPAPELAELAFFIGSWEANGTFHSNGGRATQISTGCEGDRLVFIGQMTYGGYRFTLRDTFTRRGDAYHHLGEVDLGQGRILADEERAHRRRGAHGGREP